MVVGWWRTTCGRRDGPGEDASNSAILEITGHRIGDRGTRSGVTPKGTKETRRRDEEEGCGFAEVRGAKVYDPARFTTQRGRNGTMKKICGLAVLVLLAVSGMVAQEHYTEGPGWRVELIRVKPTKMDAYLTSLRQATKPFIDEEKK